MQIRWLILAAIALALLLPARAGNSMQLDPASGEREHEICSALGGSAASQPAPYPGVAQTPFRNRSG